MYTSALYLLMMTTQSFSGSAATYASFEQMPGEVMEVTYYYEDGSVRQTGFIKDDELTGTWITYDKSGNVTARAYYEDGKKTGKWKVYDSEGKLVYKILYRNDVKLWVHHFNGSDASEEMAVN